MTPSYFGLTNDFTWLSVDEQYYKKLKPTHRMICYPAPKQLSDEEIWDRYKTYPRSPDARTDIVGFVNAIIKEITE